jgi:hypothetical protein
MARAGIPVTAAIWGRRPDSKRRCLYLVTPAVNGQDPRPTYGAINRILDQQAAEGLTPVDWASVELVGTDTSAGRAVTEIVASLPQRSGVLVTRQPLGDSGIVARLVVPAPAA